MKTIGHRPTWHSYWKHLLGLILHHVAFFFRFRIKSVGLEKLSPEYLNPDKGILFLSNHSCNLDGPMMTYVLADHANINVNPWTIDFAHNLSYFSFLAGLWYLPAVPNVTERRDPKDPQKVEDLVSESITRLNDGESILIFPSGMCKLTPHERVSYTSGVKRILEKMPDVNIVFLRTTGMWGSRFSRAIKRGGEWHTATADWTGLFKHYLKMFFVNMFFFIPKRHVTIEYLPATEEFPRKGSMIEVNRYIEKVLNAAWPPQGEPVNRVSDYFWKESYPDYAYYINQLNYDVEGVPESIRERVLEIISKKTDVPIDQMHDEMHLGYDLGIDSVAHTEILVELEQKYQIEEMCPYDHKVIGQLIAAAAHRPFSKTFQEMPL